jgi:hypothetical protein
MGENSPNQVTLAVTWKCGAVHNLAALADKTKWRENFGGKILARKKRAGCSFRERGSPPSSFLQTLAFGK